MQIVDMSALELASALRRRNLGASEVLAAFIGRIEEVNPTVNAIVTLCLEDAERQATKMDQCRHVPADMPLFGLPIAIKDLALTAGLRTTFGSPIYADYVPDTDDLHVARLKAAGAIVVGKTNTPEFGAGSQTFNPVFLTVYISHYYKGYFAAALNNSCFH